MMRILTITGTAILTFMSCSVYAQPVTKDSPLVSSGLLGPVKLFAEE
jgi:hypothetical protein